MGRRQARGVHAQVGQRRGNDDCYWAGPRIAPKTSPTCPALRWWGGWGVHTVAGPAGWRAGGMALLVGMHGGRGGALLPMLN
jgi:hypothetical protein